MIFPDERGLYRCEYDDFVTDNIFAYLEHADIDFDWMIKIDKRYSFNMFTFLNHITRLFIDKEYQEAWEAIQGVSLMFVNSTGDDFDEFLKEAEVISGIENMFDDIEKYLKETDGK